jgi:hypothetical protein
MRREAGWGAAGLVAVAAAIGISSLPRPSNSPAPAQNNAHAASAGKKQHQEQAKANSQTPAKINRVCSDLEDVLQAFFVTEAVSAPGDCLEDTNKNASADKNKNSQPSTIPATNKSPNELIARAAHLKFVIAIVPDPIHTHFSLLFDRFAEAIQQGAQDQGYEYDSSWLPWDTSEQDFPILSDEDAADERKSDREDEPGVLLFRNSKTTDPPNSACDDPSELYAYCRGLAVFVVAEEPTRGIHRKQFENAVKWIEALRYSKQPAPEISILGPTFSGSLPSLRQLLSNKEKDNDINDYLVSNSKLDHVLPIYSGSVTGGDSAKAFANASSLPPLSGLNISFHSFHQDDDTTLNLFCRYLIYPKTAPDWGKLIYRVAVISEDETAYGYDIADPANQASAPGNAKATRNCMDAALRLYYPRDIAALRTAYQTQSILKPGSSGQPSDAPRTTLPTDIADPAGEEHDTIRSYGGDHTTVSHESELLAMAQVLRTHRIHYVILRSSNSLDAIFLTSFLRRNYPDARVIIMGADSLFQRDQGPSGLSGLMTLGTYPLMPWSQDWMDSSQAVQSQREFPDYSAEATYIATRTLLQSDLCRSRVNSGATFVPKLAEPHCNPLPDYGLPVWTTDPSADTNFQPPTWLAVLGKNGFWPVAMLNEESLTLPADRKSKRAGDSPRVLYFPWGMKFVLFVLLGVTLAHASGCWFASLTAKPAIRAHFANPGTRRHAILIALGSAIIACAAIILWWGSGWLFLGPSNPIVYPWFAAPIFLVVIALSLASLWLNTLAQKRLMSHEVTAIEKSFAAAETSDLGFKGKLPLNLAVDLAKRTPYHFLLHFLLGTVIFLVLLGTFAASLAWVESRFFDANEVFSHWRAIFLSSGVSPVLPLMFLAVGLYLWFLYALHGLALFASDRPLLPQKIDLQLKGEDGKKLDLLAMFSQENASLTEKAAKPLSNLTLGVTAVFFVIMLFIGKATGDGHMPIRGLGQHGSYPTVFGFLFALFFSIVLADAVQLLSTWNKLRALLVFLDRTRLRRTLAALRGFSWGSVWKMSGTVLEVRYKLLSRQLESLHHIENGFKTNPTYLSYYVNKQLQAEVAKTLDAAREFAKWYSPNYSDSEASGLWLLRSFQVDVAAVTGKLMTGVLLPAWSREGDSLILDPNQKSDDSRPSVPPLPEDHFIRNCEELVCLTYLGFIQNILGRMRTIVMQIIWMFIAATLSVSCYPFDPRTALSLSLLVLFIAIGVVITFVYADMHKDATLSHVTNTDPGSLGSEFWFKLVAFGAGPVLGLLTTVFPGMAGFVFSWLQPGISSLK